jgi:hypothetical protein
MTPKEALARIEDRELSLKEIEELLAFAEDICARVLGPDWRNWPRKETKPAEQLGAAPPGSDTHPLAARPPA